jgi:hypothetical protein
MTSYLKSLARKSKTAIILFKIFDNWRISRRVNSGGIETLHGSTHLNYSLQDSVAYIEKQFKEYLDYAELSDDALVDKKVIELGPGDNLGIALRFLSAGARCVICVDRFFSKRDPDCEREIYSALRKKLSKVERSRFDEAVSLGQGIRLNPDRLQLVHGRTLEGMVDTLDSHGAFDFIVSCAVLEEIYDLNRTFEAMDKLLAPSGYLIHKVDLTDYGMFRNQGMHPLTFLTISESLYRRMASDSGLPNRERLGFYIKKMKEFGYDARFFVTSTISRGRIEPAQEYLMGAFTDRGDLDLYRSRLAKSFRHVTSDELNIDGILMVARKPA